MFRLYRCYIPDRPTTRVLKLPLLKLFFQHHQASASSGQCYAKTRQINRLNDDTAAHCIVRQALSRTFPAEPMLTRQSHRQITSRHILLADRTDQTAILSLFSLDNPSDLQILDSAAAYDIPSSQYAFVDVHRSSSLGYHVREHIQELHRCNCAGCNRRIRSRAAPYRWGRWTVRETKCADIDVVLEDFHSVECGAGYEQGW
jgi:hypothetical protein